MTDGCSTRVNLVEIYLEEGNRGEGGGGWAGNKGYFPSDVLAFMIDRIRLFFLFFSYPCGTDYAEGRMKEKTDPPVTACWSRPALPAAESETAGEGVNIRRDD